MTDPMLYMMADMHVDEAETHREHNDRLREFFDRLKKILSPGDVVQFYGDSVDSPTRGNYAKLLQVISPLIDAKCGLSFIVGNHDNSKTGLFWWNGGDAMFQAFCKQVSALPRSFMVGNCQMLNLDTTLHTWLPTDLAQGEIGDGSLRWLKRELDKARDRRLLSLVGGHHDPGNTIEPERLLDAAKLFNVLRRGKATYYICGHSHAYNIFSQRFQNVPGVVENFTGGKTVPTVTEIITLSDPKTKYARDGWFFGPMVINLGTGAFMGDSDTRKLLISFPDANI